MMIYHSIDHSIVFDGIVGIDKYLMITIQLIFYALSN